MVWSVFGAKQVFSYDGAKSGANKIPNSWKQKKNHLKKQS